MRLSHGILLLGVSLPLLSAVPAAAQEFSAFGVIASTDNVEFPSPVGGGASIGWEFGGAWLFRLSYLRTYDSTDKEGAVCIVYSPRIGCHTEEVHTSDSFSGLRFGIMRTVHVADIVRVGAGLGVSLNAIDINARGVSGQRADMERPLTAMDGFLAMLHVTVSPVPGLPLGLTAGAQQHWVRFNSCSEEIYDPFCSPSSFREVEVGLVYRIR